jgi:hypothetical protein
VVRQHQRRQRAVSSGAAVAASCGVIGGSTSTKFASAGAVACPRSASGVASTTTAGPPPHAAVPVPVTFASAPASSFTSLPSA